MAHWRIAAVLLLASATSLFNLGGTTLWNDEAFSFYVAHDGLRKTIYNIATDNHPPLYYLILSVFLEFGTDVFLIRLPSALALVATSVLVYCTAAKLFGARVGLCAGLLAAINPDLIDWSQKARPYSVQTMFVALAFWGLTRVVLSEFAATRWIGAGVRDWLRTGRWKELHADLGWAAFAVGSAAAVLTQHPGALFVLSANAIAFYRWVVDRNNRPRWLLNWLIAQAVILALWLLWLPGFVGQMSAILYSAQHGGEGRGGGPFFPSANQVVESILGHFGVTSLWKARYVAWALYGCVFLLGIWQLRRYRLSAVLVLVPAFVPIAIAVLGFNLVHPIFGHLVNIMRWLQITYIMIIAVAIASSGPLRRLRHVLGILIVAVNLWALRNYYSVVHPPIDEIAQFIAAQADPGDGIIFPLNEMLRFNVGYYLRSSGKDIYGLDLTRDGEHLIRTLAQADANHRNWVLKPEGQSKMVDLSTRGPATFERKFGSVTLLRFDH